MEVNNLSTLEGWTYDVLRQNCCFQHPAVYNIASGMLQNEVRS